MTDSNPLDETQDLQVLPQKHAAAVEHRQRIGRYRIERVLGKGGFGLVHRDVKPGNILIGKDGQPYVVDFGLALQEENFGKGPKYAGTPAYMSPEQARGEGHRVDGRSDIFSLGVVFYELLAGRQPFRGDTRGELFEQVTTCEAKPLRQYDDNIPKELERICHKAMAKRASERYSTAKDFSDDLRHFLAEQTVIESGTSPGGVTPVASSTLALTQGSTSKGSTPQGLKAASSASVGLGSSDSQPIKIVPKGLRSFDAHDADFFLELLPGARDREGLPDSVRFWKTRIEEGDADHTFAVGLLYGPSGCGKSSLVKAGLLPRLSEDVISVYIESTPEETETRLLHGLRKRCPALEVNRLPTEAEWEYACRAGKTTDFSSGSDVELLRKYAWYQSSRAGPGGAKLPNDWGLFDMQGNVCEWCHDWNGLYGMGPVTDPLNERRGTRRVVRGGGWTEGAAHCRAARRDADDPSDGGRDYGFRLALSPSGVSGPAEQDQGGK